MATATVKYTFVNGTSGDSDQVDQNFGDIITFLNTKVLQQDGGTMDVGKFLTLPGNGAGLMNAVPVQQLAAGVPVENQIVGIHTLANTADPAIGGFGAPPYTWWGTYPTDSVVFSNPSRKVSIIAHLHGYVSSTINRFTTGSTILSMNTTGAVIGGVSSRLNPDTSAPASLGTVINSLAALTEIEVAQTLVWTGIPTSDVTIFAQISDPTNNDLTWKNGTITAMMIPAV